MTVRRWTRGDVDRIAELERECFREPWSERSLGESFENPWFECWVAERDGVVLGYAGFEAAAGNAYVANIATDPGVRRQGIARELLLAILRDLKDRGFEGITLEVRTGNFGARRLYESLGFVCEGTRPRFYSDGEDAQIYWLRF